MTTETRESIYLDYNATAPCRDEVIADMVEVLGNATGNPSSVHGEGRLARNLVEQSRARIAQAIGAEPSEIVFASGGTEADNLAVFGTALAATAAKPHLVTSRIEHPAILAACRAAVARNLAEATFVACDTAGHVDPNAVAEAVRPDTALVSIMHANNEVGAVQPIRRIAELVRSRGVLVHSDAVQSLGKIPVDVNELGVDLLSVSGHKLGGPMGIGALYVRSGTPLAPMLLGGSQERELRAGTENVSGIVGFARAVEIAVERQLSEERRLVGLKLWLWSELAAIPGISLNGELETSLPNTLNVSFADLRGDDLMEVLDEAGIAVSTGSACAVGAGKRSHVLEAMGGSERGCGPVRISMGYRTTEEDVAQCAAALRHAVARLRNSGKRCCCAA